MNASLSNPEPTRLYDLDRAATEELLTGWGEPRYRADQLWRWLYQEHQQDVAGMTDLPRALRDALAERTRIALLTPVERTDAEDGLAEKWLFELPDAQQIETVLMHYVDPADEDEAEPGEIPSGRHTVCLSTQAGCAMGCVFCATGQMGLLRDLSRGECVAQVLFMARRLAERGERLSNVVFMGMGEPLANWPATRGTIETLVDPMGLAMSPRRITVSTVGIAPGIRRLAELPWPVRLAVSLHAPDDALRDRLVAANQIYPLGEILDACRAFQEAGGRRITFEYVLIRGVNDRREHARGLARRLEGLQAHVNLIPLNPTAGSPLRPSRYDDAAAFAELLRAAGWATTLRMRRGIEIQAGCGQLRARSSAGRVGRTLPMAAEPPDARPADVEAHS